MNLDLKISRIGSCQHLPMPETSANFAGSSDFMRLVGRSHVKKLIVKKRNQLNLGRKGE